MLILFLKNNNCSTGGEKVFNTFNFQMLKTFRSGCKLQTVIYTLCILYKKYIYFFIKTLDKKYMLMYNDEADCCRQSIWRYSSVG